MADPTPVEIAGGLGTQATTTVSFSAQTAGTVLILSVASDDYRTTSGSGRPESTSWTYLNGQQGNLGHYVWYKISTGAETSVQYTIGSNARSAYTLATLDQMDASPLGVSGTSATGVVSNTPTPQSVAGVTPTAGSRWCVVAAVGSTGANTSGPYTWAGGYTKLSERYNTTGYRPGTTIATRTLDGGTSVTGTVAFTATGVEQVYSIVSAWKVAAAGGTQYPVSGQTDATTATSLTVALGQPVSGTTAATVATSATVAARLAVSGQSAATVGTSLTAGAMLLAAQGSTAASSTTSLATAARLGITGTTDATTAASLTTVLTRPVTGTTDAVSATSLTAGLSQPVAGSTAATSTTALAVVGVHPVAGTTAASSAVSLTAGLSQPVSGSTDAVSAASMTVNLLPGGSLAVSGTSTAVSNTALTVGIRAAVTGQVDATSTTALDVTSRLPVTGVAGAAATTVLTVGVLRAVSGQADAVTAVSLTAGRSQPVTGLADVVSGVSLTVDVIVGDALAASGTTAAVSGVALAVTVRAAVTGQTAATSGAALTVTAVLLVGGTIPVVTAVRLTVGSSADNLRDITFTATLGSPSWSAMAGTPSWTATIGDPVQISTLSKEFVAAKITARYANGSAAVVLDTQPVYLGLTPAGTAPQLNQFFPATWVGPASTVRWCRMLVGPDGGVATYAPGEYDVYARVDDVTELAVRQAVGKVTVQ